MKINNKIPAPREGQLILLLSDQPTYPIVTSLSIRLILLQWAIDSRVACRDADSRACISLIERARDIDTDVVQ